MTAISKEWMEKYLQKLDGSPISVYIDEEESFHPEPHTIFTIQFIFSALRPDGNWQTGRSEFAVRDDGLLDEDADIKFEQFFKRVMGQYYDFIAKVMGFTEHGQELMTRLVECQRGLKLANDAALMSKELTKKVSKKALRSDRRH